jgi:hypothetical protein
VVSGICINGILGPECVFYSDKAWLTLRGYMNSENNKCGSTENSYAVCKVPRNDMKISIWYAISAPRRTITGIFAR